MQCKDVEAVVEQEGLAPLPKRSKLAPRRVRECRNYIADLTRHCGCDPQMPSEITPRTVSGFSLAPSSSWKELSGNPPDTGLGADFVVGEVQRIVPQPALATATVGLLIIVAGFLQLRTRMVPAETHPRRFAL